MLGYYRPKEETPETVNNKRLRLLIKNLENIVELLKEEVLSDNEKDEKNVICLEDLINKIQNEYEDDVVYKEE